MFVELPRVGTENDCEIGLELVPERHEQDERVRAPESRAERREDHERDAEDREGFSARPHPYQSSASLRPVSRAAALRTDQSTMPARREAPLPRTRLLRE